MNKKKKVLIIDDDVGQCHILDKWLKNDGYTTIMTATGEEGLNTAKEKLPDCILLDLMLPDVNGIDIAKELLLDSSTKNIPIVFITITMGVENDKGDEEIEVDGAYFRAFAKPLHQRKLLSVVRKEINKKINNN